MILQVFRIPVRTGVFLLLAGCLVLSCTGQKPSPPRKPTPDPKPPVEKKTCPAVLPVPQELALREFSAIENLDMMPRYVERMQLHVRTLDRQRYKVMISGEKNWREHFYLAVLLWRMAEVEENALKIPPPVDGDAKEILEYRKALRTIQNYRTESLLHLDYLNHLPNMTPAALERLAYYTAAVHGARAIPYFYKLLEHPKVPDFRYYVLDFAGLLLSDGRCEEARTILSRGIPQEHAPRKVYLQGLLHLCKPDAGTMTWPELCEKVPEGSWHEFLPVLARGIWLGRMDGDIPTDELKKLCPQVAGEGARLQHFLHLYSEVDQKWRPIRATLPEGPVSGENLFAAIQPTLAGLAGIWRKLFPAADKWQLVYEHPGWILEVPGMDVPARVRALLTATLPVLPVADKECPPRFIWNISLKKSMKSKTMPEKTTR